MCATGESAPCGDPPCVATHHLNDGDAVMRCGGGGDPIERLSNDVCCGVEAEAALGPPDVVIHRLWNRVDRCAALGETCGNGEGVIATDGDQSVEAKRTHVRLGGIKATLALQQVRAARAEHGAALRLNAVHGCAIKRSREWRANRGETLPAIQNANYFVTASRRAVHHGANCRVEAWAVAATG